MIFLLTDKVSQEVKNYPIALNINMPARKGQTSLDTKKRTDKDKAAVRMQDPLLPDAQWHRSKAARFSQY
ncbi:MAG: hypothetical protein RQ714_00020 [Nitrosomonas sp.]|nr:hypothetical protein [Nitrosomonas sp.]